MSESTRIILAVVFLVAVYIISRYVMVWNLERTVGAIIKDLESKGAVDPDTAVDLPYLKPNPIRFGFRDYNSKALAFLMGEGIVGKIDDGKHYLKKSPDLKVPNETL